MLLRIGRLSTPSRLYANPLFEHDFFREPGARFRALASKCFEGGSGDSVSPRSPADREFRLRRGGGAQEEPGNQTDLIRRFFETTLPGSPCGARSSKAIKTAWGWHR